MTSDVLHLFADIGSMAEDMHAITAEGHCRDNSPDIQRVLISQLRMTIKALDERMGHIENQLAAGHD